MQIIGYTNTRQHTPDVPTQLQMTDDSNLLSTIGWLLYKPHMNLMPSWELTLALSSPTSVDLSHQIFVNTKIADEIKQIQAKGKKPVMSKKSLRYLVLEFEWEMCGSKNSSFRVGDFEQKR